MSKIKSLSEFSNNVYSQHGEDGILKKIFDIIGVKHKSCIEFGAWDALYLSTTAQFWKEQDWYAVLIEGDPNKFQELVTNTKSYDVLPIQTMVGYGKSDNLDSILKKNKAKKNYDLLVIDVDGDDYYIWEAVKKIKPRVVVCEYNSNIPPHLDLRQQKGKRSGCGILTLSNLAKKKGYVLVALTKTNGIFVDKKYKDKFSTYETNLENIFDKSWLNYVICNYDGYYRFTRSPLWGDNGIDTNLLVGDSYTPLNTSRRILHLLFGSTYKFLKKHNLLNFIKK